MPKDNLTETAYQHLQQQILSGVLRAGNVVSESGVAKELGISRTPVGQAIKQLVQEGLVEQIPRFGTIVREIDWREIEELYELREALESYAASRAAEKISPAQIAQLDLLCARIEQIAHQLESQPIVVLEDEMLQEFLAADMAFHLLVIRASGNQRILKTIRETRTISHIFRIRRQRHDWKIVRRAFDDHVRILDAMKRRDSNAAGEQMAEHIRASKNATLELIRSHQRDVKLNTTMFRELPEKLVEALHRLEDDVL